MSKVAFIGLWHLGCVSSAGLAKLGHSVTGWDEDSRTVENLGKGVPPLFEPGLEELVKEQLKEGRLFFDRRLDNVLSGAEFIFISYDTPVNEKDQLDLSVIWRAVRKTAALLKKDQTVTLVIQSQVPVGTCEEIGKYFKDQNRSVAIACLPENLRLGQALMSFFEPDRFAIGAESEETRRRVAALFSSLQEKPLLTDLRTAEMAKHATNALLASTICFANELSELCESMGADALKLSQILLKDRRFNSRMPLRPGLSFSGGTLARDLRILEGVGKKTKRPLPLINSLLRSNDEHHAYVVDRVKKLVRYPGQAKRAPGTSKTWIPAQGRNDKPVLSVLGLAYKAGTSTLRRSLPLAIVKDLIKWGAKIQAHDPQINPQELPKLKGLSFHADPYDTMKNADAILFLTEWDEFKRLDYSKAHGLVRTPLAIDLKNMFENGTLEKSGFRHVRCGQAVGAAA